MAQTIGSLDLNAFSDLHSDLTQYFWFEPNASATHGAGAHVTLVPDASFISNPTGQNILMNTDGFSIRNGLLPMMTLDNNSLDFNVVDTTEGTYTTTATFTSTGAQIGQSSGAHSVIDANGQRFYASNGTTQLANIGYGSGASESGTATAPYYDFGIRKSGTTKGNYSVAEGVDTTASGYASHAEGYNTIASGSYAHSGGEGAEAIGEDSFSHGNNTIANEPATSAFGVGIETNCGAQTVLGRYNYIDPTIIRFTMMEEQEFIYAGGSSRPSGRIYVKADQYDASNVDTLLTYDIVGVEYYCEYDKTFYYDLRYGFRNTFNSFEIKLKKDTYNKLYVGLYVTTSDVEEGYYLNYKGISGLKITLLKSTKAFVIGNGTSNGTRSNALTVDWDGNVEASGNVTDGSGNVLSNKQELMAVERHSASVSLPASNSATINVTMTKSGYKFIGVVGFQCNGTGATLGFVSSAFKYNDTTATVILRNSTSTARSFTLYVYGLYVKN